MPLAQLGQRPSALLEQPEPRLKALVQQVQQRLESRRQGLTEQLP